MPSAPAGVKVEIEFGNSWTDVTNDVDWNQGLTLTVGRKTKLSKPSPSSISLRLRNPNGVYTPGLQVLKDGTTLAPHYPHVMPGVKLKYSWTSGVRFEAPVQSWKPVLQGGVLCDVDLVAVDVTDRLSRVKLASAIVTEVLADEPVAFWPMTDQAGPDGNLSAAEFTGGIWGDLNVVGSGTALQFGQAGPPGAEGTTVGFTPASDTDGQFLQADAAVPMPVPAGYTIEVWVRPATLTPAWPWQVLRLWNRSLSYPYYVQIHVDATTPGELLAAGTTSGPVVNDAHFHHVVVVVPVAAQPEVYVDGVSVGTGFLVFPFKPSRLQVGGAASPFDWVNAPLGLYGRIGPVALYDKVLSADRVAMHYLAGTGFAHETVDQRIKRLLGYGGLAAGTPFGAGLFGAGPFGGRVDLDLDVSGVVLNPYPQAGTDPISASQEAVDTEGGSAVLYAAAGKVRFRNRDFRTPAAPVLTVDSSKHLDRGYYAPAVDATTVLNEASVTRKSGDTDLETITVRDQDSVDAYGLASTDLSSWALLTRTELPIYLAQDVVAAAAQPGYELDQVAVDLLSSTSDLNPADVAAVEIGSRIRVTNLPAVTAAATQLDAIAEGWTETAKLGQHLVVFDCSPADNPAWCVADDAAYGLAQAEGQTLAANATAAAATVSATTGAGESLFSTDPADAGFDIRIGAERMTVTAVTGAASPQTLTVTRGVAGTRAAAHSAGDEIELALLATATI